MYLLAAAVAPSNEPMTKRHIDRLRELIESRGVSTVLDGCRATSKATLYSIKNDRPDGRNPTLDVLQDIIENGCGLTLGQFFKELSPERPEDAPLWEMFRDSLMDWRRRPVEGQLRALADVARDRGAGQASTEQSGLPQTPKGTSRLKRDRAS